MMSTNDEEASVKVSKTKARGGVTGHNVRYVLTFGLMGVIAAFIALGIYYGLGDKPKPSEPTPPASQGAPATGGTGVIPRGVHLNNARGKHHGMAKLSEAQAR